MLKQKGRRRGRGGRDNGDVRHGVRVAMELAVGSWQLAVGASKQAASRGVSVADRGHGTRRAAREGQLSSLEMRNTIKAQGESQ